MIDDLTFDEVAQAGHFAGGAAIVLAVVVASHNAKWFAAYGFLAVLVLAAIKEFWYDYKYETDEVRGSSIEDFLFYLAGAAAATAFSYLFPR